jgi:hypothetical protein
MFRYLASLILLFGISMSLTACFDSKDPEKVQLEDKRGEDSTNHKQAVSDEDFAALQEKIRALEATITSLKTQVSGYEAELDVVNSSLSGHTATLNSHASTLTSQAAALSGVQSTVTSQGTSIVALQTDVASLEADITAHDTELTAIASSLSSLEQATPKTLWMYDGNKVKRHKVVSLYDRTAWQEAIVEIADGVNARYRLNRFTPTSEGPAELENSGGTLPSILYTGSSCTGTPLALDTSHGADYGQAGTIGNYVVWVTKATTRYDGYTRNSYYDGTSCTTDSATSTGKASAAVVSAKSLYMYANPITVGP